MLKTYKTFEGSGNKEIVTEYIVGVTSGEVIYVTPPQLAKLKSEHLIKFREHLGYFTFQDANYNNIKKSILNPLQIQYIHYFMESNGISNYKINTDLSVDVKGNVNISKKGLTSIPVKFGKIDGHFDCSDNKLTNLVHSPNKVNGYFDCSENMLYTLIGGPKHVGGGYYCAGNKLEDLQGYPEHCKTTFDCSRNIIKSLEGLPEVIDADHFIISFNKLRNLKNGPIKTKNFDCSHNLINTLSNGIRDVKGTFDCSYNLLSNLFDMPTCHKIIFREGNNIEVNYD